MILFNIDCVSKQEAEENIYTQEPASNRRVENTAQ
jgi:hypothetical protein